MSVCSICESPNANRRTCPCNLEAINPDYEKHLYWYETCPKAKNYNIPIIKKTIKINNKNKMLILCGGWDDAVNIPARKVLEDYYKVNFNKNNTTTAHPTDVSGKNYTGADITYNLFFLDNPVPSDMSFIFIEYCPLDLYLIMSMVPEPQRIFEPREFSIPQRIFEPRELKTPHVQFTPSVKRLFQILPIGGQVIMPLITRSDFDDPINLDESENALILTESQKIDLMGSMGFNVKDIIQFPNKFGISNLIIYERVI